MSSISDKKPRLFASKLWATSAEKWFPVWYLGTWTRNECVKNAVGEGVKICLVVFFGERGLLLFTLVWNPLSPKPLSIKYSHENWGVGASFCRFCGGDFLKEWIWKFKCSAGHNKQVGTAQEAYSKDFSNFFLENPEPVRKTEDFHLWTQFQTDAEVWFPLW